GADHGADVRDDGRRGADSRRPVQRPRDHSHDATEPRRNLRLDRGQLQAVPEHPRADHLRDAVLAHLTPGRAQAAGRTRPLSALGSATLRSASGIGRVPPMTDEQNDLRKLAIVPAYNEERMVGRVVREIRRNAPDFDIVVVDDGSTDGTVIEAQAEDVIVIQHPFNLGIGGAVQSGFKYAAANGYDVAAQVDGDRQHKPAHLEDLVEHLRTGGSADMVCGSRFLEDPGYKVPIGRRIGNLIFSVVLSAIVRRRITDPTSGFRAMNRRGIELFARDYPHD